MKKIRLLLIALGFHSKRIYVPIIKSVSQKYNVEIEGIVELIEKEEDIKQYYKNEKLPTLLLTKQFKYKIPSNFRKKLSSFVRDRKIDGVLITTEPLSHKAYAEWALSEGLHILMDKPITTRYNAVTSLKQAKGIYDDYELLLSNYKKLQEFKQTAFTINVQRRYHPGFNYVLNEIAKMARISGSPVTSIHSMHSDGEWRLPLEIKNGYYHAYSVGNGKASHSGYHIYDISQQFYTTSIKNLPTKKADTFTSMSTMVQPTGILKTLTTDDYIKYFGDKYNSIKPDNEADLSREFEHYGEVNVSTLVNLKLDRYSIGIMSFDLIHNGFTRRSWMYPKKDLYKGNGRVKHESHNIQQGPFQNIQIHSYQSKDDHSINNQEDFEIGGNNHFDIHIYRNPKFVNKKASLEIITFKDLMHKAGYTDKELVVEQAKKEVVTEFLDFIAGNIMKDKLKSNIDSHEFSVKIMSSVYQSLARQYTKTDPIVTNKLDISSV